MFVEVNEYKYEKANVNVDYHVKCDDGRAFNVAGKIKIKGHTYDNIHFETISQTPQPGKCNKKSSSCLKHVETNSLITDREKIFDGFYKCFPQPGMNDICFDINLSNAG